MPDRLIFRFQAFYAVNVYERIEGTISGKQIYRVYHVWGTFGGWMVAKESIRALLRCTSHALLLQRHITAPFMFAQVIDVICAVQSWA